MAINAAREEIKGRLKRTREIRASDILFIFAWIERLETSLESLNFSLSSLKQEMKDQVLRMRPSSMKMRRTSVLPKKSSKK